MFCRFVTLTRFLPFHRGKNHMCLSSVVISVAQKHLKAKICHFIGENGRVKWVRRSGINA